MADGQIIGFVGYGAMASRMARHLREAGHTILAYRPSQKNGTAPDGTEFTSTPRALAERSDVVMLSLPNDTAQAAATDGPDGLLAGLSSGMLVINTSTVSPPSAEALARAIGEKGAAAIDAPVSGSTPEAEGAQLLVLVGGADADVARARPVLERIGKAVIHAGPAGHGAKLKLVINGIMGAGMAALAESVALGLAAGLDRRMLVEALDQVAVLSPHHKRKLKSAAAGDLKPQFPTSLMLKDMGLVLSAGAAHGVPLPTLAAATQLLSLSRRDHEKEDYSALLTVMESLAANDRS
ncbi:NAD(P)-dependent oxidoreductase [Rhizosaccharibacter radicis]|uniref:NAD(P)-dependent oxidoreductase n=1 Tax=Rhizosaccharibacter radicis TaxID=2782605 RepID=A0ABT1VW63_9PROT|nr:NAD(P)-dependent oxidoreductase [Acetobacteraceae bacterium KSS12]